LPVSDFYFVLVKNIDQLAFTNAMSAIRTAGQLLEFPSRMQTMLTNTCDMEFMFAAQLE
jgi:hypothetical protein